MDFLKIVSEIPPTQRQAILEIYMGADKGFFMAGYMVGMLVDTIMLGLIIQQFTHWWEYARGDDKPVVRSIVYFSVAFSIGLSVYLAVWIFHMFVYGYGDYSVFIEVSWLSWWFLADVVIRIPVQGFFAERAWQTTGRSYWYGALLIVLYVCAIGSGVAVKVFLPQLDHTDLSHNLILVWVVIEIVSDMLVTATIAWRLCTARTGYAHTDALLTRLLKIVLETQLPPTVLAVTFLIVFLTETVGSGSRAFVFAPKGYVICLLAVLNSRQSLRRDMSSENSFMKNMSKRNRDPLNNLDNGISVTTDTYTHISERERGHGKAMNRRSVNRDIQLSSVEFANRQMDDIDEEDKKDLDGDTLEVNDLESHSSKVRLTGDGERE